MGLIRQTGKGRVAGDEVSVRRQYPTYRGFGYPSHDTYNMITSLSNLRKIIRESLQKNGTLDLKVADVSSIDKLYHATSELNVDSIMRQGLVPKNNWEDQIPEPAVFVINDMYAALDMYEWINHKGQAVVFEIDVQKLLSLNPNIIFYNDVDSGTGAYWTPSVIPSSVLTLVEFDDLSSHGVDGTHTRLKSLGVPFDSGWLDCMFEEEADT